jgi:hypothetical protein
MRPRTEDYITEHKLNRDNPTDRATAVRAVLASWKTGDKGDLATNAITPADVQAIVAKAAPTLVADPDGGGQHFTRGDLARLPSGVSNPPSVSTSRRGDLQPPTVSNARNAGAPPITSLAGAWNTPLVSKSTKTYGEYGSQVTDADMAWAAQLGSPTRVEHVREVASRFGLRLNIPDQRERAVALAFSELRGTVEAAYSVDEAMHAALRRLGCDPRRVTFSEDAKRLMREAGAIVARERPDLVGEKYRGNPRAVPSAKPMNLAERARNFSEKLDEMLREQKLPRTPENISRATKAIAQLHPELIDDFGRSERRGW